MAKEKKRTSNKLPDASKISTSFRATAFLAAEENKLSEAEHTVTSFHRVTLQEPDRIDSYRVFCPQSNGAPSSSEDATELGTLSVASYFAGRTPEPFLMVTYIRADTMVSGKRLFSCEYQLDSCAQLKGVPKAGRGRLAPQPEETHCRDSVQIAGFPCTVDIQMQFVLDYPLHFYGCPLKGRALKASLLEDGEKTGDLLLICKDGSKLHAHSAVLVCIPYFEAKLKNDWSGTGWNKNNKLELTLPCPVDRNVVEAFLKYAYGDTWSLEVLELSDASFQQDLFSLAEACGLFALCSIIESRLVVTPDSVFSWLEWLSQEHGPIVRNIRAKVEQVVKTPFSAKEFWGGLTVEELSSLEGVAKRHRRSV